MASNNNITAVHFSLIFFVMISIILGVISYMKFKDANEYLTAKDAAEQKQKELKTERDNALDSAHLVVRETGYGTADVDDVDNQDSNTSLVKQITTDHNIVKGMYENGNWRRDYKMAKPGNVREDLFALISAYNIILAQKRTEDSKYKADVAAFEVAKAKFNKDVKQFEEDVKKEREKVAVIERQKKEAIDAAEAKTTEALALLRTRTIELADARDAHKKVVAEYDRKIKQLTDTVLLKQAIIDEIKKESFERPDGVVMWVDQGTKLVWINLGEADRLPHRLSFSVYSKAHHGIARGRDDIKGSIEITRIIGKHLAEARIVENDIYNPVRAGDPIYTPLWSAGAKETFAFVGLVDLDGDGVSDRQLLYRRIRAAGATISDEVDDKGVRRGKGLSGDVKFLVRGKILDPRETADPNERKIRNAIARELKIIEDEARRRGIRILRLADFLAYIGYKADRRLWRPGTPVPWNLKSGSRSTTVNETIGKRQSSGQTSGVYSRSKRLKQPKSSGQTSKIFGGGRGGY
ncbi:MAG: hypothetical protein IID45_01555 [Planctomycetes bacterium]|nr:hypothetical protein [Planctomycetota bacterium]